MEDQTAINLMQQQVDLLKAIEKNGSAQKLSVNLAAAEFTQAKNEWVQDVFDKSKLGFRNGDFADPAGSMKQITEHYENLGTMNPYIFSKNFAIDHYNSSQNKIAIDTENLRKNPDDLIKIIADMSTFNRGDGYSYTGAFGQKLGKELGWGKKPIKLSFQVLKAHFLKFKGISTTGLFLL